MVLYVCLLTLNIDKLLRFVRDTGAFQSVIPNDVLSFNEKSGFGKTFPSREQLILEQKQDPTLSPMFEYVVPDKTLLNVASGYFIRDGF